jgi:hypothetical protein
MSKNSKVKPVILIIFVDENPPAQGVPVATGSIIGQQNELSGDVDV